MFTLSLKLILAHLYICHACTESDRYVSLCRLWQKQASFTVWHISLALDAEKLAAIARRTGGFQCLAQCGLQRYLRS